MNKNGEESVCASIAFAAYEAVLATGFIAFFTPYALIKMTYAPAYRAGIAQRLALRIPAGAAERGAGPIWVQAVSLGEVKSVAPLVRKLAESYPIPIFLTTTTATGFRVANEMLGNRSVVSYFPLDFTPIVKRALTKVQPRVIVLFETEIWPNFIRAASSSKIPVIIVNGRISERSFKHYRFLPNVFRNVVSRISFAGMQSGADAEKIVALGADPERVDVCGNMKFDAAPGPPSNEEVEQLRKTLSLENGAPLVVAGSTHEGEEEAMLRVYGEILDALPSVRLLLAPRHPERFERVETLIRHHGFEVQRRSGSLEARGKNSRAVILLDTIGELSRVYALAAVGFVGGSLAAIGGHNIIEPAAAGAPVVFGPHMFHFEDVKEAFLSENGAVCVADEKMLAERMLDILTNPETAARLRENAKRVVDANRGATDRYCRAIERFL